MDDREPPIRTLRDVDFAADGSDATTVLVVVAPAISQDNIRSPTWPAALAPHRRHSLKKRDQLGDVVAIAAGQGDRGGMPDASLS